MKPTSALLITLALASTATHAEPYVLDIPGPASFTMGSSGSPLNAADLGLINVPGGAYHGLRMTYTVRATNPNAKPYDVPMQFYYNLPGETVWHAPTVQGAITPNPVVGPMNAQSMTYSFDFPIFFYRSFGVTPIPFPGAMTIGLRGRNLVLNNTATWSNMHIEFYPAKVSVFTGDNHSSGTWNRPIINPRQGIDLGRDTDITEFTAIPFQVDMTGIYGIHTQLHGGTGVLEGVTYLFQGDVPVTGPYTNVLDANLQGLYGVGYTDINSVNLVAGQTYTLVQSQDNPAPHYTFTSYIVGLGRVVDSCEADLDDGNSTGTPDQAVTIDDLLFYIEAFTAGTLRADVDDSTGSGLPDGAVSIDDLLYYLDHFNAGC